MGAIASGKTICGTLFGGTVLLGYLHGVSGPPASGVRDAKRMEAIDSVASLFRGFIERFGATDCRTLTGCDFGEEEDRNRYHVEGVFERKCLRYYRYVLAACLTRIRELPRGSGE